MGPRVEALVNQREGLRLLRIDIDQWDSPVARQFGIRRLPTLWLYEGRERVTTDSRAAFEAASAEEE